MFYFYKKKKNLKVSGFKEILQIKFIKVFYSLQFIFCLEASKNKNIRLNLNQRNISFARLNC